MDRRIKGYREWEVYNYTKGIIIETVTIWLFKLGILEYLSTHIQRTLQITLLHLDAPSCLTSLTPSFLFGSYLTSRGNSNNSGKGKRTE